MFKKIFVSSMIFAIVCWSFGFAAMGVVFAATLSAGDLIKASGAAVYYYGDDGKRYVFPTESTYMSWYADFSAVKTITDAELAAISIGGNATVRPGTKLVKINTDPKTYAVSTGGVLQHVDSETRAVTLYGADWASRIVDIPESFWINYTAGSAISSDVHPDGALIKYDGAPEVCLIEDGKKRAITGDAFTANRFKDADIITIADTLTYSYGAGVTEKEASANVDGGASATPTPGGDLTAALASDTPTSGYVSKGAQNAVFMKVNVSASNGDAIVSKIVIERKGLGYDADLGTIRLYDGNTQIGNDQSLNTTNHKVTFTNLNWTVSNGTTANLFVKANIDSSAAGTNDYLQIVEIVANDAVSATLPIIGNAMSFSALTVGTFDVVAANTGAATVMSGATDQELGCWTFVTGSDEGFYIDSLKITNIGSGSSVDASSFVLKVGSIAVDGSEVASMASNGTITFDLTADPYFIDKSKTKKFCMYGDIAEGITVSRTLNFQVAEAKDLVARGDSSAGEVLIVASSAAFTSQTSKIVTIAQGSATLAQNSAYNPVTGTAFVKGVTSNKMAAYKLSAGSTEGVKLTKLRVILPAASNVANTDFNNWQIYQIVDGAEVLIPVSGSVSGINITFEDTTDGLVDVAKSENETIIVRADVSTSAGGDETDVHAYVGADATTNTLVRIKGLESNDYITSGVTLSGVDTGDAQKFTIGSAGSVALTKASSSPSPETFSKGDTGIHFTTVNVYSTGEDAEVTELVVTAYEGSGTGNAVDTGEISNIRLEDADGNALGTTVSAPNSSGEATFSFSLTAPKEDNTVIKIFADIPSGSTATTTHIDVDTAATDITSNGVYSSTDITETGTVTGSLMTIGTPTITATMATIPVADSYVTGSTGVTLGTLVLTANTVEDIKVTSVKISVDDAAALNSGSSSDTDLSTFYLVDADNITTQYGTTQNLTTSTPDYVNFTGISGLTVTKGTSKNLLIKATVVGSSGSYYAGVQNPSTEITGVGVTSNTSATVSGSSAIASTLATLASKGTLTFGLDASTPSIALNSVGASGLGTLETEMLVMGAVAQYEDIDITKLVFTLNGGVAANFQTNGVKLYHKIGTGSENLIGSTNMISTSATFNLSVGDLAIQEGEDNLLIVKALLNGTNNGTSAGNSPAVDFGNGTNGDDDTFITAQGAQSGTTLVDADLNSTSGIDINGNAQVLRKTVPTMTYESVGTTVLYNALENDVFKFNVAADAYANVSMKQLKFTASLIDNQGTDDTLTATGFKIYRGSTDITADVSIRDNIGTNIKTGDFVESTSTAVIITWTSEENVPASSDYTYTIKATLNGFSHDADDDQFRMRLADDSTQIANSTFYLAYDSSVTTIVELTDSAATSTNDTAYNIIWSDNSAISHSYSVVASGSAATSSGDWFNGYKVNTTPTSYATLTR